MVEFHDFNYYSKKIKELKRKIVPSGVVPVTNFDTRLPNIEVRLLSEHFQLELVSRDFIASVFYKCI
mgnify:CR=1 FL=1